MRVCKEEVELVAEWLEQKLDEATDIEYIGYSDEEMEQFGYDEFMIRAAQEIVASVLNEM